MKHLAVVGLTLLFSLNLFAEEHSNTSLKKGVYKSQINGCFINIEPVDNKIQVTFFSAFDDDKFKICDRLLSLDALKNLGVENYNRRVSYYAPTESCLSSHCQIAFAVNSRNHVLILKASKETAITIKHTVNGSVIDELEYNKIDESKIRPTKSKVFSTLDIKKSFTFMDSSSVVDLRQKCVKAFSQYFSDEAKICEAEGKVNGLWERCAMFASNNYVNGFTFTPAQGQFGLKVNEFERSCNFTTSFAGGVAPYRIWILDQKI